MLAKLGRGWFYTAVSVLLNVVAVKIIAVTLGPQGIGVFALLEKLVKLAVSLGTFGGRAPLTQGIASPENEDRPFLATVAIVYLVCTGMVLLVLFAYSDRILGYLDLDGQHGFWVLAGIAVAIILAIMSEYYAGILNGRRYTDPVFIAQMSRMMTLALIAYPISLLIAEGWLALYALLFVSAQAVCFMYSLYQVGRLDLPLWPFAHHPRRLYLDRFVSFSLMVFFGALVGQGGVYASRIIIVHYHGLDAAGLFEAAWTISATYIGLVLNAIGMYFLPEVSSEMELERRNRVIKRVLVLTIIITTVALSGMIALKPLLLRLLYSEEFMPAISMIKWMLAGELLKTISWVFAIAILGARSGLWYLLTSSIFIAIFIGIILVWMPANPDMEIVGQAYFVSAICYFLVSCAVMGWKFMYRFHRSDMQLMSAAFFLLGAVSYYFWFDQELVWSKILGAGLFTALYALVMIAYWGDGVFFKSREVTN